jgi:hypothetical protein
VFWPFDVLGQKVDVFVVDVLEIVQLGRPALMCINFSDIETFSDFLSSNLAIK